MADLPVAGIVPMSTVDFPGRLAAVAFLQGCPWVCDYCQNPTTAANDLPAVYGWQDVEALLARRVGLLDALVFSGGEATMHPGLPAAAARARSLGFEVGLHTAGSNPARLERLLDDRLVDWVGLDIKEMPGRYAAVVGFDRGGLPWRALDALLASGIDYEVRTTITPDIDPVPIAEALAQRGVTRFALQQARPQGTSPTFAAWAQTWGRGWFAAAAERVQAVLPEVVLRPDPAHVPSGRAPTI